MKELLKALITRARSRSEPVKMPVACLEAEGVLWRHAAVVSRFHPGCRDGSGGSTATAVIDRRHRGFRSTQEWKAPCSLESEGITRYPGSRLLTPDFAKRRAGGCELRFTSSHTPGHSWRRRGNRLPRDRGCRSGSRRWAGRFSLRRRYACTRECAASRPC